MIDLALAFLRESRYYLRDAYLPRIEACVARLSDEDLWWRPNEASNSVGNLLLHLSGNVRQWIASGLGDAEDVRVRQEEFDARGPMPREALLERLRGVLDEADHVLAGLDPTTLLETRQIQGKRVTVLQAVYHVVEHFSMHTGQIIYVTKLRTGADLGFYEVTGGTARSRFQVSGFRSQVGGQEPDTKPET